MVLLRSDEIVFFRCFKCIVSIECEAFPDKPAESSDETFHPDICRRGERLHFANDLQPIKLSLCFA